VIRLFHQNMQNYNSVNAVRNALFDNCFAAIQAKTGADYLAAGFTEVRVAPVADIIARAQALDPTLANAIVIEVGRTALSPAAENIGIAWDNGCLRVRHYGQVLYNSTMGRWVCYNNACPNGAVPAALAMPNVGQLGLDSRGLAYIAGDFLATRHVVIAFMHNMYKVGDRSIAFEQLWRMRDLIIQAIRASDSTGANTAWETYVGGDFNVDPSNSGTSRGMLTYAAARYYNNNQGRYYYYNTTWFNTYDFWLTDTQCVDDDAEMAGETRYRFASDHSGIILKI